MNLSHRIQLNPNKKQIEYFTKACGVARFAYNWALEQSKSQEKLNLPELKKEFNKIKKEQFPWIYEVHKDANQQVFSDLNKSFIRFFKKQSKYPKFKNKHRNNSFYVSNDKFRVEGRYIILPVIGSVKMTEELRFDGKILSARVTKRADKWFVAISCELLDYKLDRISDGAIGIDLGIKTALVCSNGEEFQAPKPLKKNLEKLKKLQKSASRKIKGSQNRKKANQKVAKLHYKISNIRKDFLNKVSTKICRENQTIVIEDLHVKGMMRNHCLARAISDIGFAEFRRQLEYKSQIYRNKLKIADRWFPSSKLCSNCGSLKEDLTLKDRTYKCDCGLEIDRDLNAALNLLSLGLRDNACGHENLYS